VALVAIALAICIRKRIAAFAAGIAVAVVPVILWLAARGAFRPMLDSLLWSAANYSGPNRTPYAWVNGGYANLFLGSSGMEIAAIVGVMLFFTLPATLPFVSAIWIFKHPKPRVIVLLAAVPFYALTAALIATSRIRVTVALVTMIIAVSYLGLAVKQRMGETVMATPIGRVHGDPSDLAMLQDVEARVLGFEGLFVFPYRPILYFVTGARNPTRYSFLQPGMFPEKDELTALNELKADPPAWIFYMDLPEGVYMRIWPASDRARLRMGHIEDFIRGNYHLVEQQRDIQLLRKNTAGREENGR
jgi:hypothetical protein